MNWSPDKWLAPRRVETPDVAADIARLQGICTTHGIPIQAAALQFPLMHPAVAAVVVGMRSPSEVEQNIGFLHHPIPDAFWRELAANRLISGRHLPIIRGEA